MFTKWTSYDNNNNKNVDIKFTAHDTFLKYSSSCILKIERLYSNLNQSFVSNKTKAAKEDSQNGLQSPLPEGGET